MPFIIVIEEEDPIKYMQEVWDFANEIAETCKKHNVIHSGPVLAGCVHKACSMAGFDLVEQALLYELVVKQLSDTPLRRPVAPSSPTHPGSGARN